MKPSHCPIPPCWWKVGSSFVVHILLIDWGSRGLFWNGKKQPVKNQMVPYSRSQTDLKKHHLHPYLHMWLSSCTHSRQGGPRCVETSRLLDAPWCRIRRFCRMQRQSKAESLQLMLIVDCPASAEVASRRCSHALNFGWTLGWRYWCRRDVWARQRPSASDKKSIYLNRHLLWTFWESWSGWNFCLTMITNHVSNFFFAMCQSIDHWGGYTLRNVLHSNLEASED